MKSNQHVQVNNALGAAKESKLYVTEEFKLTTTAALFFNTISGRFSQCSAIIESQY